MRRRSLFAVPAAAVAAALPVVEPQMVEMHVADVTPILPLSDLTPSQVNDIIRLAESRIRRLLYVGEPVVFRVPAHG